MSYLQERAWQAKVEEVSLADVDAVDDQDAGCDQMLKYPNHKCMFHK